MFKRLRRELRRLMLCSVIVALPAGHVRAQSNEGEAVSTPTFVQSSSSDAANSYVLARPTTAMVARPPLKELVSVNVGADSADSGGIAIYIHEFVAEASTKVMPEAEQLTCGGLCTHDSAPLSRRTACGFDRSLASFADPARSVRDVVVQQVAEPFVSVQTVSDKWLCRIAKWQRWCWTTLQEVAASIKPAEPQKPAPEQKFAVIVPFVDFELRMIGSRHHGPQLYDPFNRRPIGFRLSGKLPDACQSPERPCERAVASADGVELLQRDLESLTLEEPIDVETHVDAVTLSESLERTRSEVVDTSGERLTPAQKEQRQDAEPLVGSSVMIVTLAADEEYVPYDLAADDTAPVGQAWSDAFSGWIDQPLCVRAPVGINVLPLACPTRYRLALRDRSARSLGASERRAVTADAAGDVAEASSVTGTAADDLLEDAGGLPEDWVRNYQFVSKSLTPIVESLRPQRLGSRLAAIAAQGTAIIRAAAVAVAPERSSRPLPPSTAGTKLLARAGAKVNTAAAPTALAEAADKSSLTPTDAAEVVLVNGGAADAGEVDFNRAVAKLKQWWSIARRLGGEAVRIAGRYPSGSALR